MLFYHLLQNCSPAFLEDSKENEFLTATTFSESSLTNEEAIMWTKGEILGKGAYGTVSYWKYIYHNILPSQTIFTIAVFIVFLKTF